MKWKGVKWNQDIINWTEPKWRSEEVKPEIRNGHNKKHTNWSEMKWSLTHRTKQTEMKRNEMKPRYCRAPRYWSERSQVKWSQGKWSQPGECSVSSAVKVPRRRGIPLYYSPPLNAHSFISDTTLFAPTLRGINAARPRCCLPVTCYLLPVSSV